MATSQGTFESNTGLGVQSHYGARGTADAGGQLSTDGIYQELRIVVDGTMASNGGLPLTRQTLPAGCKVIEVITDVQEVFALGGTTPTILVGTDGSEATNGAVALSEAQAEATGIYVQSTLNGTWAAELAAETTVDIAMGGGTPTSTSAGKAVVVIRYVKSI